MADALVELRDVSVVYPGVVALNRVTLSFSAATVHALVGENGAGKTTLIRVLTGVVRPKAGRVLFENQPHQPRNAGEARRRGIVAVDQELDIFPDLSVRENIALWTGAYETRFWSVPWASLEERIGQALEKLPRPVPDHLPAGLLSPPQRQLMLLATLFLLPLRVVVLDEPTSALSDSEAAWVMEQVRYLRQQGICVIYISHRQEEIFQIADRIHVLRDGSLVWSGRPEQTSQQELIQHMVGRPVPARQATGQAKAGPVVLELKQWKSEDGRFGPVDLQLRQGEIVGLYGLAGAGRTRLARSLVGLVKASGQMRLAGRPVSPRSPRHALRLGMAYVPEDRRQEGIFHGLAVRLNIVLSALWRLARYGWCPAGAEQAAAQSLAHQLSIRCRNLQQRAGELSGGNQQKVVLARWWSCGPRIWILDEPTRGIDVHAKQEVQQLVRKMVQQGGTVLWVSSELPELLQHADRIVVMRQGQIAGQFPGDSANPQAIARAAMHQTARPSSAPGLSRRRALWWWVRHSEIPLAALLVLLGSWLALGGGFQLWHFAAQASLWVILTMAAGCVILAGGIDVSIGALLALAAFTAASLLQLPLPDLARIPLATAGAVAVGAAGGWLNGRLSWWGGVHPLVVTLGSMTVYRGLVIAMMGRQAITSLPPALGRLAVDPAGGHHPAPWIAAVLVVLVAWWIHQTPSGRKLVAAGSAPRTATLCGISPAGMQILAFTASGLLIGLAAVLHLAQSGQMQAGLGMGWELQAIAGAVIGGVAIEGGRGSVGGMVLGALLLRMIHSALVRWGIAPQQVELVVGTLILAAVLWDRGWRALTERFVR